MKTNFKRSSLFLGVQNRSWEIDASEERCLSMETYVNHPLMRFFEDHVSHPSAICWTLFRTFHSLYHDQKHQRGVDVWSHPTTWSILCCPSPLEEARQTRNTDDKKKDSRNETPSIKPPMNWRSSSKQGQQVCSSWAIWVSFHMLVANVMFNRRRSVSAHLCGSRMTLI